MPVGIWNQQWLNENSQRSYPLTEVATKVDSSGAFTLPDDFILGISFPVHSGMDVSPGRFFLRQLDIFGIGYNITLAYDDGTGSPPIVAATVIARSTHTEYDSYALPGQNDFNDSVGQIVIGKLDTIDSLAPGSYTFDAAGGQLEVDAIRPMVQYVSGIILLNNGSRSERLVGDIEIEAGTNFAVSAAVVVGENPVIRLSAIEGEGLNDECVCTDESEGICIKTINGIPPTAAGDFTILGDTCLEVSSITNGLQLEDKCSEPCCSCAELEALTVELELFGSAAATVQGFVNRLQAEVTQMSQVVLGSLLQDDGCVSCDVGE
jgi:hypothetical protein